MALYKITGPDGKTIEAPTLKDALRIMHNSFELDEATEVTIKKFRGRNDG